MVLTLAKIMMDIMKGIKHYTPKITRLIRFTPHAPVALLILAMLAGVQQIQQ